MKVAAATKNNESDLISLSLRGDRAAFGELVCCYHKSVINVVYRMCGDRHLAEDAAQEAFIKAWTKLGSYRPGTSFRNWVFRIAVNTALDMLRKQKSHQQITIEDFEMEASDPLPENTLINTEWAKKVQAAVLSLPPASRSVLVLREYEGFSYQEIADMLDIPRGTVMSRLNYARGRLREILEPELSAMEVEYA